jgi:transmembrane 9 superfamily protein 2/4
LEWQNRWDMYFIAQDDSANVHWLAIVNSLVICGLLTAVVSVVLTRTIRSDIRGHRDVSGIISKPNRRSSSSKQEKGNLLGPVADLDTDDLVSDEEEIEDVAGWKLLHGDVFRAPVYGGLLAPLVGSGMQLLYMAFGLLVLSTLGVLNPSFRGGYVSVGVGLFVFAGIFSGYFSSRIYKTLGGQMWQKNVVVTASLVPGLLFATIFILNLFLWIQASSTALPFGTLIALLMLWLFVQLPLVYVGSWFGFERMGAYTHPIRANTIPRQIPDPRWYLKSGQRLLLAGFVPFMVIFVELMFVVKSLWVDKTTYYYVFGFTGVVSVVLAITVAEVTLVATYLLLCSENYHWWWHSFAIGGSSSIWVYAYLVYSYFTRLHISGFVSSMLFFTYSLLACAVYALLTGTIGFLAAYAFVRRIYGAIKVD